MLRLPTAILILLLLLPASFTRASASTTVRVGILRDQDRVVVLSDRPIDVRAGAGQRTVLMPGAYELVPGGAGIDVGDAGEFSGPIRLIPAPEARLFVAIRPYRGILEIRRTPSGRLTIINELDLEEYLYGVLKMEVDPLWPVEALKAQAVAARTLAVYNLGRYQSEGYDVRATTDTQVYGGISAEDPRTTAAVDVTRGEILVYQGRPILAVYHSDSGGATESSEYVWGGRYPYLKGVPDPLTSSAPWSVKMDLGAFEARLRRAGKNVAGVVSISTGDFTPSGRVGSVRIVSRAGTVALRATELRGLLGADVMKSTLFTVRLLPDEQPAVEFAGRGSGHGVGMSQWGARGQALQGRSYADILRYYYTGVTIESR